MFLDDTACNLASINLMKFFNESTGVFNVDGFRHACRLWTLTLEISVAMAQFPNAEIARKIIDHADLSDRIHVVLGTLGNGGQTLDHLESVCGLSAGGLDFIFIDHAKDAYLPDLRLILEKGWLHPGSIVVADNIRVPGAPEYRAYMKKQEGKLWRSKEHKTFAEYQSIIPDIVLESYYLNN